jgi:FkbM family methyltransferase
VPMQLSRALVKKAIRAAARVVRREPAALDYLLTVCLRDDVLALKKRSASILNDPYEHVREGARLAASTGRPGPVVVDVGAAWGDTAQILLDELRPSRLYLFEPLRSYLETLTQRFGNDPSIVILDRAVGRAEGRLNLHCSVNNGSSSLLPLRGGSKDAPHLAGALAQIADEPVTVTTLDAALPAHDCIDLLKLDVQGFELEVLRGAPSTLSRTHVAVVELANHELYEGGAQYHEVDAELRSRGFVLAGQFPSLFVPGRLLEWNAVYVNSSRTAGALTIGVGPHQTSLLKEVPSS